MGWTKAQITSAALRTGYPVKAAWVAGHGTMGTVVGPMLHHTATPDTYRGDYPTLNVIQKGRSDLPGPLANYGLGRSGTIYTITEGIAWHAGAGSYGGITDGNGHWLGIEGESAGTGHWTPEQVDCFERLTASILYQTGRASNWAIRHAGWAPRRKIDTVGLNMTLLYARVGAYLENPLTINKNYGRDEYDMDAAELIRTLNTKEGRDAIKTAVWYHMQFAKSDTETADPAAYQVMRRGQRSTLDLDNRVRAVVVDELGKLEGRLMDAIAALKPPDQPAT